MKTLIIGIGNEYRSDDAVGLTVARQLRELHLPQIEIIESDGEFTNLMVAWENAEEVILIDAMQSGAAPGTIHCYAAHQETLPASGQQGSTHGFGVAEAIAMAKACGQLPAQCWVYGIEAASFAYGMRLTPMISQAVPALVEMILQEQLLARLHSSLEAAYHGEPKGEQQMTPEIPSVMAAPNRSKVKAKILSVEQSSQYPDKWLLQFEVLASTALTGPNFAQVGDTVAGFTFMNTAELKPQDIVEADAEYIGGATGGQFQLTNLQRGGTANE